MQCPNSNAYNSMAKLLYLVALQNSFDMDRVSVMKEFESVSSYLYIVNRLYFSVVPWFVRYEPLIP